LIRDSIEGDRVVFMRHNVDPSLNAAKTMAEVDKTCGINSTFYFMIRSNFYNLFSPEARRVIKDISNSGHQLGIHFVCDSNEGEEFYAFRLEAQIQNESSMASHYYGDTFRKTVSFHNPPREVFGLKLVNFVNAYENTYFKEIKYLSESNQRWREGDLYWIISEGHYNKLQILTHPALWVFSGDSLTATMESFLTSEKVTGKDLSGKTVFCSEYRNGCRKST
jgi:hypothetical protein